jgi:hypothetical protein
MNRRSKAMQGYAFDRVSSRENQNRTRTHPYSKHVVFSAKDQVRVFSPDLQYDDEAFICTARKFLRFIEQDRRKKSESRSRWFTNPFDSESSIEFDDGKIEKFREAFEHRLSELPEIKNDRFSKVDSVIRDLAHVVHSAGWPREPGEDYGHANSIDGISSFSKNGSVQSKSNAVDEIVLIKQRIRSRLAEDRAVETVLNEMRFLSEVSRSTTEMEVKELCARELKGMEHILEDMGYIRSASIM